MHDPVAALDYARKLKTLSEKVEENFIIVMRAYFEKPRTSLGWKGLLHDPHLDGSYDIKKGLRVTRELLLELTKLQVPLACEFLDPLAAHYLSDLVTWGSIGARTVSSQIHRHMASSFNFPIGFKNTTDGNIELALQGIEVAKHPHTFMGISYDGTLKLNKTDGNPHGHLVLRGSDQETNYHLPLLEDELGSCQKLIIDCSHGNSGKRAQEQIKVFEDVFQQVLNGERRIKGVMLESFLNSGSQPLHTPLSYGISITDSCLDYQTTEEIILKQASLLQSNQTHCEITCALT